MITILTREEYSRLGSSMFSVWGISKIKCRSKAEQTIGMYENNKQLGFYQYKDRLEQETERLYESARPTKLSAEFGSRALAEAYMQLVKDKHTARDLEIRRLVCDTDRSGKPIINPKTGRKTGVRWVKG